VYILVVLGCALAFAYLEIEPTAFDFNHCESAENACFLKDPVGSLGSGPPGEDAARIASYRRHSMISVSAFWSVAWVKHANVYTT